MLKRKLLVVFLLVMVLIPTSGARAWYGCDAYVTVQWGDTLSSLAAYCGTTVEAIRAANPGLGWWLYAGQVIYLPGGYIPPVVNHPPQNPGLNTYVVQAGDTMGTIAARYGISFYDLWAANPHIWNPSLIYVGQVLYLPASSYHPAPPPPPVYNPPHPQKPPTSSTTLKITYKKGLFVRNGPGGDIIGWATYDEFKEWCYFANTITKDHVGKVWVQVTLDPPQHGYTTGWILLKDQYGSYFTTLTP